MEILEQFKVTLKPDTAQMAYMNYENIELPIEILKFNDGSIRVTIPNMTSDLNHRYCHIEAFIQSADDLVVVSQIKDIVNRLSKAPKDFSLTILSTPYTRYDRVMYDSKIDGFGAKVFADLLNTLEFSCITFLDCHSQVMLELVEKSLEVPQETLVTKMVNLEEYNLIAPDKGATKKNPNADIIFDKVRNVETGQITGMKVEKSQPKMTKIKHLVVDDICEGGRTFIECAKLFRNKVSKTKQLDIYITHGIFSNGAVAKLAEHYNNIYTFVMKKSLYDELDESLKAKLHVKNLINL